MWYQLLLNIYADGSELSDILNNKDKAIERVLNPKPQPKGREYRIENNKAKRER